jgi:hypothetical protein
MAFFLCGLEAHSHEQAADLLLQLQMLMQNSSFETHICAMFVNHDQYFRTRHAALVIVLIHITCHVITFLNLINVIHLCFVKLSFYSSACSIDI